MAGRVDVRVEGYFNLEEEASITVDPLEVLEMIETLTRRAMARNTTEGKPGHAELKGKENPGILSIIDTFDRPAKTFHTTKGCSGFKTYANGFENEPGKRLPKIGVVASTGGYHDRAEWSIFAAEAKGPNARIGAEASLASLGAEVYAKAELVNASASAGPLKAKLGLAADTGIRLSVTGIQAEFLGTGLSFGRTMGFSLFGTGVEFNFW